MAKKRSNGAEEIPAEEIEVEPPPEQRQASDSERAKAAKLRLKVRAGLPLTPGEAGWLGNYEKQREAYESFGAARSHEVTFSEKTHEAMGTGEAAAAAMGYAQMEREAGKRLDTIIERGFSMMTRACEMSFKLAEQVLADKVEDAKTQRALMDSVREHYLARTQIEADKMIDDATRAAEDAEGEDPISKLANQLLPALAPHFAKMMAGGGK